MDRGSDYTNEGMVNILLLVLAEDEYRVMPAKAKRIGHGGLHLAPARLVGYIV